MNGGGSGGGQESGRGIERKFQGGAGGVIERMALNRGRLMAPQCTTRAVLHSSIAGRRSHGGRQPDDIMEMTGGDVNVGDGAHCIARKLMKRQDTDDLGNCDGAAATTA